LEEQQWHVQNGLQKSDAASGCECVAETIAMELLVFMGAT